MKQHNEAFLELVSDAKTRIKEINVQELRRKQKAGEKFLLVDVREESEWNAGHAAGAIHLGKGVIERDVEKTVPEKSTPMVLYCGGGFRSALAADSLQRMGYGNVLSLDGGWRDYTSAGLPVEK